MLEVYRPGSSVKIGPRSDTIIGTVVEVEIGCSDRVRYNVTWWDGRTHNEGWFASCEVRRHDADKMPIGFADGQPAAARGAIF